MQAGTATLVPGLDRAITVLQPTGDQYEGTTRVRARPVRLQLLLVLLVIGTVVPAPVVAARPQPQGPSTISFSGYDWSVKSYSRKIGPGPNLFAANNVSVDAGGRLHLRIQRSGNRWTCAEVIANASLGYGTYTWVIDSTANLDPNAVLGMFTWHDDPAYAHRELDIELARWGNAADPTNGQYVVQPYDAPNHLARFTQPATAAGTVHSFTWAPGRVDFVSRTASGELIAQYSYIGADVPVPGGENPRINLWLFRGSAPQSGQAQEVVFRSFTFAP